MIKDINPYAKEYMHVGDIIKQKPTEDVRLVLKATRRTADPQRYNIPTGSDVAAVIPTDSLIYKNAAHHPNGLSLMNIDTRHPMYDPLMYVVIFPHGDKGWEDGCHQLINRRKEDCTALMYYQYRLMPQRGETFNSIHRMGRLFQQYVVDMYAKIEYGSNMDPILGKRSFCHPVSQGVQDTSTNSIKMQWLLCDTWESLISSLHLHVTLSGKNLYRTDVRKPNI